MFVGLKLQKLSAKRWLRKSAEEYGYAPHLRHYHPENMDFIFIQREICGARDVKEPAIIFTRGPSPVMATSPVPIVPMVPVILAI